MTLHNDARGTAFASDYDGTLCISNWETGEERFDPRVVEAVRRYQEAGGLFGICTGRPLFSVENGVKGVVDLDFYIVTTGAQVLDRRKNVLFERTFDVGLGNELYKRYMAEGVSYVAITESEYLGVGTPFGLASHVVGTLDEIEGKLLGVSLEFHGDEAAARAARDDMNRRFGDVIEGFQNKGSVDVVMRGCSKGSGVDVLHRELGVECVVGIGDSYNDLALLEAADVSYTFHSSPQEVRDAADRVVSDLAAALVDYL